MKRRIVIIFAIALCFILLGGCSNKEPNGSISGTNIFDSENNGQLSESDGKTTYTFSEYLRESYDAPLLFFTISKVTKDNEIYRIYVVQDGKVKEYKNYGGKTLGDYARMSDAEILTYLEEKWEKEFCAFVQTFIDDTAWPSRFRAGEATIYMKDYVVPKIQLVTDDTGNNVARETIYFPEESPLTLDSTVWYQGHMWDKTTDYDFVNNRSISSMASSYSFDSNSEMYEIYSSRYAGLAPAKDYGYSRYLLTRTTKDITITLDHDLNDDTIVVDIDYLAEQDLAYSFYQQYRENYQPFDEVSKRFASLKLPETPTTLHIGYTEWDDFSYVDADGRLTGYDIELIQKLCDELGIATDFVVFSSFSVAKEALNKGSIDCLVGGLIQEDIRDFYVIDSCRVYHFDNSAFRHCGLAFRKDLEGLALFSQACDKFSKDGTIGSLLNKYHHAYAKD